MQKWKVTSKQAEQCSITRFESSNNSAPKIANPKNAKTKGRGKNVGRPSKSNPRFKSMRELRVPRLKACKKCNQPDHSSRNCYNDLHP